MDQNGKGHLQTRLDDSSESTLATIVDELAERIRLGEAIDWELYHEKGLPFARELQELAPAIEIVAKFGGAGPIRPRQHDE